MIIKSTAMFFDTGILLVRKSGILKSIADYCIHKVNIVYVILMSSYFCEFAHIHTTKDAQNAPTPLNYNELDRIMVSGMRACQSWIYMLIDQSMISGKGAENNGRFGVSEILFPGRCGHLPGTTTIIDVTARCPHLAVCSTKNKCDCIDCVKLEDYIKIQSRDIITSISQEG